LLHQSIVDGAMTPFLLLALNSHMVGLLVRFQR
jgi:hypothetical protein